MSGEPTRFDRMELMADFLTAHRGHFMFVGADEQVEQAIDDLADAGRAVIERCEGDVIVTMISTEAH